jgi:YD repeat-containing protein
MKLFVCALFALSIISVEAAHAQGRVGTNPSLLSSKTLDEFRAMAAASRAAGESPNPVDVDEDESRKVLSSVPSEQINPRNLALSFDVTDLSVKGIGPTINVSRRLSLQDVFDVSGGSNGDYFAAILHTRAVSYDIADWQLQIPHIKMVTSIFKSSTHCMNPTPANYNYAVLNSLGQLLRNETIFGYQFYAGTYLAGLQELEDRELLKPTNADYGTSKYATTDNWIGDCNGNNEWIVRAPDGSRYTFNEIAVETDPIEPLPVIREPDFQFYVLGWKKYYVTKIEDRFGNFLTYNYDHTYTDRPLLSNIVASDGRRVDFTWTPIAGWTSQFASPPAKLSSITANAKTITFNYDASGRMLSSTTYPAGQGWSYQRITNGTNKQFKLTTPRNHVATYDLVLQTFKRRPGTPVASSWSAYQVRLRSDPLEAFAYTDRVNVSGLSWVSVVTNYDDLHVQKTYFAREDQATNVWTEGMLLRSQNYERCDETTNTCAGNVLGALREQHDYSIVRVKDTFASPVGDFLDIGNGRFSVRRVASNKTARAGVVYESTSSNYDVYGNAGRTLEVGSDGTNRVTLNTYQNTLPTASNRRLLLGLPIARTLGPDDSTVLSTTLWDYFDTGALKSETKDGVRSELLSYNADGTLATATDALNHLTTFANYYRGLPQLMTYADGTTKRMVVAADGTISSITDELARVTNFKYDALYRLAEIQPPLGATTYINWSFDGQTKTNTRGTALKVTTFDGLGNTLTESMRDSILGDVSFKKSSFDSAKRKIFDTFRYPNAGSVPFIADGMAYLYDGLDRVIKTTEQSATGTFASTQTFSPEKIVATNAVAIPQHNFSVRTARRAMSNCCAAKRR